MWWRSRVNAARIGIMYTINFLWIFRLGGRVCLPAAALLLVLLGLPFVQPAADDGPVPLAVTTQTGTHLFLVEIAESPEERGRGLMERRSLPLNTGMFFIFEDVDIIQMWMKNTYVPLDMIFADEKGKVVSVASDTKPMSLDIISSLRPAKSVLEVRAGTAARLGIGIGDTVELRR